MHYAEFLYLSLTERIRIKRKKKTKKQYTWHIFCYFFQEWKLSAVLTTYTWSPIWKGIFSKKEELAPHWSKCFPYRVDPFQQRDKNKFWQSCCPWKYQFSFKLWTLSVYYVVIYCNNLQSLDCSVCNLKGNGDKLLFFFPFWKRVYYKREEFAPLGSKFFPFRVDPFSEGDWCIGTQTGSHKSYLPCKKNSR